MPILLLGPEATPVPAVGGAVRAEERAVTIRGTHEAIDKAVKGIEEIIESRGAEGCVDNLWIIYR